MNIFLLKKINYNYQIFICRITRKNKMYKEKGKGKGTGNYFCAYGKNNSQMYKITNSNS